MTSRGDEQRWQKFADAFTGVAAGNYSEAARAAGYRGNDRSLRESARRLLKRPEVQAMIKAKQAADPLVKDGEALRRFWSDVIEGKEFVEVANGKKRKYSASMRERIKASELLAKAQGMFIDRHEHEHMGAVEIVTVQMPANGRDP